MEDLFKYTHIVFGSEHYNPLGIIRSLGENGIKPVGVFFKSKRKIASSSKYLSKIHYVNNKEEGLQIILDNYVKNSSLKPFVYTADDKLTSFLDSQYDSLNDKIYFYNAGKANRVTEFMNKKTILEIAKRHGLNVIDSITLNKNCIGNVEEKKLDNLIYPVLTKAISPTKTNWKGDSIVCQTKEELKQALAMIQSEEILIQHFINKKNDGISVAKGKQVLYAIASTYNYVLQNFYSFDMNITNCNKKDITEKLDAVFAEIGFEGICEIEFLVDQDETLYFSEINFRNSTWSYASTCVGMNLPLLWAESTLLGELPPNALKKIPENYRAIQELSDFKRRVLSCKENIFSWLKKVRKAQCLYVYNKKDPRPFWAYFYL